MPIKLDIGVSGITELSDRLKALSQRDSPERDEIYIGVLSELGRKLVLRLESETPKGVSGDLARSTSFRITITQDQETRETIYTLEIIQTADTNTFVYRPIVVSGRNPGKMPPALALRGWVELKWGLTGPEADRGAFRLARYIAAFGTASNPYTQKVVVASEEDIQIAANELGQQLSIEIFDF